MRMVVCDGGSFAVRWRLQKRASGWSAAPPRAAVSLRLTMRFPTRGSKLQLKSCGPHGMMAHSATHRRCVGLERFERINFQKKSVKKS